MIEGDIQTLSPVQVSKFCPAGKEMNRLSSKGYFRVYEASKAKKELFKDVSMGEKKVLGIFMIY